MIIDKPLAELEQYKPSLTRQQDFDAFWEQTLNESADCLIWWANTMSNQKGARL